MPNRIIKESICTSDSLDGLTWFEEVLFYRLIVNCDDYGCFDGRFAVIKNRLFPLKENLTTKTVSDGINKLASAGLVCLYEHDGKPYLYLPTWKDHQNVRAKKRKYPDPESGCKQVNTSEIICNQMYANVPVIQSNPIQSESLSESRASARDSFLPDEKKKYGKYVMLTRHEFASFLSEYGTTEFQRRKDAVDLPENEGKDFVELIRCVS